MDTAELEQLPAHLTEALAAAREDRLPEPLQAAMDDAKAKPAQDKTERDYAFDIDWTAPSGRRWAGRFVHRVPSIAQSIAIADATRRWANTHDPTPLGAEAQLLVTYICALEPTLKSRPAWAKNLAALPHPSLLYAVAEEAAAHIRAFHGIPEPPAAGADAAEPD